MVFLISLWAKILNDQDIIIGRTKETSISSTCRPISSTTIADKFVYAPIRCTWYTQCRPIHPIPAKCWASVAAHCWFVFALTAIRVTLYLPKGHYPDNKINRPNCEIMLDHRLRRWANIIPTKTLGAPNHEYNREYLFLKIFQARKYLT